MALINDGSRDLEVKSFFNTMFKGYIVHEIANAAHIFKNTAAKLTPRSARHLDTPAKPPHSQVPVLFNLFSNLPTELQMQIWACALEAPCVVPRVVSTRFDTEKRAFKDKCTIPPLLHTSLSRDIAGNRYVSLTPHTDLPIFINPTIDFLLLEAHIEDVFTGLPPLAPIINPNIDVCLIRNLMLKHQPGPCPRPQPEQNLRSFASLQEIFLCMPSLSECCGERSSWLEREVAVGNKQGRMWAFVKSFQREIRIHEAANLSVVPGFKVYRRGKEIVCNGLVRDLAWLRETWTIENLVGFEYEKNWHKGVVPVVGEVRAVDVS